MDNKHEALQVVRESRVIAELAQQSYVKRMQAAGKEPNDDQAQVIYARALAAAQGSVYFKDE